MKYLKIVGIFILLGLSIPSYTQNIVGLSTNWEDSFSEWTIYSEDEDVTGEMRIQWPLDQDWTEWVFSIGDEIGQIKMKWKDNPNQWELRCQGQVITIRTVWKDDPTRWRITDNTNSYTVISKWHNLPHEWKLQETQLGSFEIYMTHEPDPRDWDIHDTLPEEVTLPIKMAMIFIAVYHSTPKW